MQLFKAFTYFARKPKTGFTNVLIGCLAPLVPVLGAMVLFGYRAEVSEELERDPDLQDYPDISLDKLMNYLNRGIAPFLAQLVFVLVFLPLTMILTLTAGFGVHAAAGEPIYGVGAGAVVFLFSTYVGMTILWPMEYHAMLTGKFSPMKEFQFAIRFLRLCGFSTVTTIFFYSILANVLLILGTLCFIIGQYPAVVIQQMAEQHLMTQLYLKYLEEGGEPLERPTRVKDERIDDWRDEDDRPRKAKRVLDDEFE